MSPFRHSCWTSVSLDVPWLRQAMVRLAAVAAAVAADADAVVTMLRGDVMRDGANSNKRGVNDASSLLFV